MKNFLTQNTGFYVIVMNLPDLQQKKKQYQINILLIILKNQKMLVPMQKKMKMIKYMIYLMKASIVLSLLLIFLKRVIYYLSSMKMILNAYLRIMMTFTEMKKMI